MQLRNILNNIEINEDWVDNYKNYVPLFIQEAATKNNWADWDEDVFHEYFEKSIHQCISSLGQGCFSNAEKKQIKENWILIAPLLKQIALSQTTPSFDTYRELKDVVLNIIGRGKEAAVHRMVAGLQPLLLTTIVTYKWLNQLHDLLTQCGIEIPDYQYNDWFRDSHSTSQLFRQAIPQHNGYEIATYPWQVREFLENLDLNTYSMNDSITNIVEIIKYKKQIILQGPPGTGKTRLAKEISKQLTRPIEITISDIRSRIKKGQTIISKFDEIKYQVADIDDGGITLQLENGNTQKRNYSSIIQAYTNLLNKRPLTGGDTYQAAIAKFILDNPNDATIKLVQFHPSYSYEDFVRGIVAESKGEKITYRNVNKILGELAADALKNFQINKEDNNQALIEKWIDEHFEEFKSKIENFIEHNQFLLSGDIGIFEVNQDCFRYGKEWGTPGRINISDFKRLITAQVQGNLNMSLNEIARELSLHAHYRATYYLSLLRKFFQEYKYAIPKNVESPKNYVLIIDEINRANLSSVLGELIHALEYRGEKVESIYRIEENSDLILPPNLYIIGTMNTADRSLGHIDYAIRRRFAFVDILPKDLSDELNEKFHKDLFDKISTFFDTNLSEEYKKKDMQLGHSYFIDKSDEGGSMNIRLEYEIKPILFEYVKDGILIGEDIEQKIINLKA